MKKGDLIKLKNNENYIFLESFSINYKKMSLLSIGEEEPKPYKQSNIVKVECMRLYDLKNKKEIVYPKFGFEDLFFACTGREAEEYKEMKEYIKK